MTLLALSGTAGASPRSLDPTPRIVDIEGNLVLVDEVYLAVIDLPDEAAATPAMAAEVARQIQQFLLRAGYTLAHVEATAIGGRIRVTVDEGRLARIVVKGRDLITSLAIRLTVDLPFDVFNLPQLERMLEKFHRGGKAAPYTLVRVREVAHDGMQLDPLSLLPGGGPRAVEPGAYELFIDFSGGPSRRSLSLVAGRDPEGLRAGGELKGASGILDDDRWELEVQVGANYFEDLRRRASELKFSRVFFDARWLGPTFIRGRVRPSLRGREDLVRRQRKDLQIESYWWNRLEGAAGISVSPRDGFELVAELGLQQRDLFGIAQVDAPETAVSLGSTSAVLWFTALTGRLVFDPERMRADRRQRLLFDVRHFVGLGGRPFWTGDAGYRRVFGFGFNELWLRSSVGGVAGAYELTDAIPMRYLRGVFGSDFYLDRAASVLLEFRVSLKRDDLKVGLFHEAAVVREAFASPSMGRVRVGDSFGPSFHALVLDVFQLDLSYAFGFLDDGAFGHGMSLHLEKAF